MGKICKIGIALGGGGARGLAHLGVLCVLEREGIAIDLLGGTSMGALVAGMYALSPRCDLIIERFRRYLNSKEFKKAYPEFLRPTILKSLKGYEGIFHRFATFIKKGIFYSQSLTGRAAISEENFSQNINLLLDDVDIEQTQIPLAVIALDLNSAEEVILQKGSLRKAVSASCAIPGILPPVRIDNRELVDGGWVDRVPVHVVREMGADLVIGVDVAEGLEDVEDLSTGLGLVLRTNEISRLTLTQWQLREADLVIAPEVSTIHWSDFGQVDECLRAGEQAAREKLGEIKNLGEKEENKEDFGSPFPGAPLFLINRG